MKKFTYVDLFFCMAFLTLTIMLWNSFTARCPLCETSLDPNQWYIWDIEDGRFAPVDSISTTRPALFPWDAKHSLYCSDHQIDVISNARFALYRGAGHRVRGIGDTPMQFPDLGFELDISYDSISECWAVWRRDLCSGTRDTLSPVLFFCHTCPLPLIGWHRTKGRCGTWTRPPISKPFASSLPVCGGGRWPPRSFSSPWRKNYACGQAGL